MDSKQNSTDVIQCNSYTTLSNTLWDSSSSSQQISIFSYEGAHTTNDMTCLLWIQNVKRCVKKRTRMNRRLGREGAPKRGSQIYLRNSSDWVLYNEKNQTDKWAHYTCEGEYRMKCLIVILGTNNTTSSHSHRGLGLSYGTLGQNCQLSLTGWNQILSTRLIFIYWVTYFSG